MSHRVAIPLLVLAFVATRLTMLHYVENPDSYRLGNAAFTADVDTVFHDVAGRITAGEEPYTDFDLEYPPGVVPFLVLPEQSWPDLGDYRSGFARLMMLVDALGLLGVILLARRWGSMVGAWMWVLLIGMVGPLAYVRFDLVPAVATVWALERASLGRWSAVGGWLGYGAITKVYPGFLLPLALVGSPRRLRLRLLVAFFAVAAATAGVIIALVGGSPVEIYRDALSSRLGAGVHLETTWGSLLLIGEQLGLPTSLEFYLATFYFRGGLAAVLEPVALLLTLAAVVVGAVVASSATGDRGVTLAYATFATMALILGFSTTFSPQFVIWLAAVTAAVMCIRSSALGWVPWLLIPIVAMTQFLYPYQYQLILDRDWLGIGVLAGRNLLVVATGLLAFAALVRSQGPEGPIPRFGAVLRDRLGPVRTRASEEAFSEKP